MKLHLSLAQFNLIIGPCLLKNKKKLARLIFITKILFVAKVKLLTLSKFSCTDSYPYPIKNRLIGYPSFNLFTNHKTSNTQVLSFLKT